MRGRKGEHVVCVNGHMAFRLGSDYPQHVPKYDQIKQEPSDPPDITGCRTCARPYARWDGVRVQLHFKDGWR